MIYLPIDLQLRLIREDLAEIKERMSYYYPVVVNEPCQDCALAASVGAGTCVYHAPEFNMRINFPL